jgi:hypothetical protein
MPRVLSVGCSSAFGVETIFRAQGDQAFRAVRSLAAEPHSPSDEARRGSSGSLEPEHHRVQIMTTVLRAVRARFRESQINTKPQVPQEGRPTPTVGGVYPERMFYGVSFRSVRSRTLSSPSSDSYALGSRPSVEAAAQGPEPEGSATFLSAATPALSTKDNDI